MRDFVGGLIICFAAFSSSVWAGGGPETTLLVVNRASQLSLAVANEYIALRDLPERQVVWIDDPGVGDTISVERFRTHVLAPIMAHIEAHGLTDEVDLIAYSVGFPYAVNFRSDEQAYGLERDRHRGDAGSLTGMTFFARQVQAGYIGYMGLRANLYFRRPVSGPRAAASAGDATTAVSGVWRFEPTQGFRSRFYWDRGGASSFQEHQRYFLSVMLGYSGSRGNSIPEILAYLERAAGSDATQPEGTVYFMENRNIRGQARRHLFPAAMEALAERGRPSQILRQGEAGQNGREPRGKTDVIGLAAGTRTFDWPGSGSKMLPGTIAESFTSYAGHFSHSSQTKLSEFLRHGAAGSSGAVREPYSFVEKFPVPQIHVYYADGSSLAEAYYQAVSGPYQLIVVGDPLARPFARFGTVSLREPDASEAWRGVVALQPVVSPPAGRLVDRVELWVNGRPMGDARPGEALKLDTSGLPDGLNEVRVVAVEGSAVQTRYYGSWQVRVANGGPGVDVASLPTALAWGEVLRLRGTAPGARQVSLKQGTRVLAEGPVQDGAWALDVDSRVIGMGPVRLYVAVALTDGSEARSAPLVFEVGEPLVLIPPGTAQGADEGHGVSLRVESTGADDVVETLVPGVSGRLPRELRRSPSGLQRIAYSGRFEARASGLYELLLEAQADLLIRVGRGFEYAARVRGGDEAVRVALPLEAGWHEFEIIADRPANDHIRAMLSGPEVAFVLAGERVRP